MELSSSRIDTHQEKSLNEVMVTRCVPRASPLGSGFVSIREDECSFSHRRTCLSRVIHGV